MKKVGFLKLQFQWIICCFLDTEKEEEDKSRDITPTRSLIEDHDRRFIDTDFETMKKSTERVDDWKTNFTIMESKIIPLDNDDQEEYSTWL